MAFQEYEHLFSAEQELAWLPHVERRYAWLKRHLLAFEEGMGSVLPRDWRLSRRIAAHFCQVGGGGGGGKGGQRPFACRLSKMENMLRAAIIQ